MQQTEIRLPIGNMIKGTASMIRRFPLGTGSKRDFNIFFSARNGLFTQLLRLRKIDGKWIYAMKVERDGKLIFEKVDDNFPKTDQGQVQW